MYHEYGVVSTCVRWCRSPDIATYRRSPCWYNSRSPAGAESSQASRFDGAVCERFVRTDWMVSGLSVAFGVFTGPADRLGSSAGFIAQFAVGGSSEAQGGADGPLVPMSVPCPCSHGG